ncbi:uncharacterized protein [Chironomus tepperi]|uniref:uncharacterized protein n=1 Tax=Chironomus tepperi TaxID=113505 RepID=UPI00391F5069
MNFGDDDYDSRDLIHNLQASKKNEAIRKRNQYPYNKTNKHVNKISKNLNQTSLSPSGSSTGSSTGQRKSHTSSDSGSDGEEIQEHVRAFKQPKISHRNEVIKKQWINPSKLRVKDAVKKDRQAYAGQRFVNLPCDTLEVVCMHLPDSDILSVIGTDIRLASSFTNSYTNLKRFQLNVNRQSISSITANKHLHVVAVKNITIDFEGISGLGGPSAIIKQFKNSVENLVLINAKFRNFEDINTFCCGFTNLKSLSMTRCNLDQSIIKSLPLMSSLNELYFNKCNDNIFKAFQAQLNVLKMTIRNDEWTWTGFPHDVVNDMLFNCTKLKHLVLIGSGTGSFFDSDNFSFKLTKLDTTMITFHWYVGIKNGRTSFLKTQKGALKELTIHKLPFDFDGGKVLKYIIEDMGLDKFYYGKIPLILNGQKQEVTEFEANEIQITSTLEMFAQFKTIKYFRFILSETDIASDEIEKRVNPTTNLFESVEVFEVIDNSRYRGTLGVYLGLFKNMKFIKKLILKTQDRNINTLLEEFLPCMYNLQEIYITSKAPRPTERFKIIGRFVGNLTKISVAPQYLEEAQKTFRNVTVCETVEK